MKKTKKIVISVFIVSAIIGIQLCTLFTAEKVNYITKDYSLDNHINLKTSGVLDVRLEWNQSGILGEYRFNHRKILAKDSEDNLYVGSSYEIGSADYCGLTKFDTDGNLQWSRTCSETYFGLYITAINVDSSDNIYMTGMIYDHLSNSQVILIKYNSSGDLQWDTTWGWLNEGEHAFAIDFDSMDNIYVAGSIWEAYSIYSMFYAKFNSTGDYKMNRTLTDFEDHRPQANDIAIDQFDNIYLAGSLHGNASLVKFDSAGNNLWNETYNYDSVSTNEALAVEVDSTGIYVVAYISTISYPLCRVIKYDSMGNELWNTFDIGDQDVNSLPVWMNELKLDSVGNIYVTGRGSTVYNSPLSLQKFNSSGNFQWGIIDPDFASGGRGLVLDSSDNIYVAGGHAMNDLFLARYGSKPEITINAPLEEEIYGKVAPHYNLSIFEPDLDEVWCSLNVGSFPIATLSGQLNQDVWDKVGNVILTIRFYANDTFGNQDFAEVSVYKDTKGPLIEIFNPAPNSKSGDSPPSYKVDVSDFQTKFTKVWYTIDGGVTNISLTSMPYSEYYERFEGVIDESEWSKASVGQITFRVYAEDALENVHFEEVSLSKEILGGVPGFNLLLVISVASLITVFYARKKMTKDKRNS